MGHSAMIPRMAFLVTVVIAVATLPACLPDTGRDSASQPADVADLPACGKPPSPAPGAPPDGAIVPTDTRITAVRPGDVTQLNGYVSAAPDAIVADVESRPGIEVEQSGGSSAHRELLLAHGSWRVYLSVRAICRNASQMSQLIAPADSDAELPVPAAAPADPTS